MDSERDKYSRTHRVDEKTWTQWVRKDPPQQRQDGTIHLRHQHSRSLASLPQRRPTRADDVGRDELFGDLQARVRQNPDLLPPAGQSAMQRRNNLPGADGIDAFRASMLGADGPRMKDKSWRNFDASGFSINGTAPPPSRQQQQMRGPSAASQPSPGSAEQQLQTPPRRASYGRRVNPELASYYDGTVLNMQANYADMMLRRPRERNYEKPMGASLMLQPLEAAPSNSRAFAKDGELFPPRSVPTHPYDASGHLTLAAAESPTLATTTKQFSSTSHLRPNLCPLDASETRAPPPRGPKDIYPVQDSEAWLHLVTQKKYDSEWLPPPHKKHGQLDPERRPPPYGIDDIRPSMFSHKETDLLPRWHPSNYHASGVGDRNLYAGRAITDIHRGAGSAAWARSQREQQQLSPGLGNDRAAFRLSSDISRLARLIG